MFLKTDTCWNMYNLLGGYKINAEAKWAWWLSNKRQYNNRNESQQEISKTYKFIKKPFHNRLSVLFMCDIEYSLKWFNVARVTGQKIDLSNRNKRFWLSPSLRLINQSHSLTDSLSSRLALIFYTKNRAINWNCTTYRQYIAVNRVDQYQDLDLDRYVITKFFMFSWNTCIFKSRVL